MCPGFHAFGDNAQSQAPGHGDDRPDQRRVARVGFKIVHKGLVNLERGQRKAFEIAQGRVTGTEVIDGQIYPELGDRDQGLQCSFLHQRAFGELQPKVLGRETVGA